MNFNLDSSKQGNDLKRSKSASMPQAVADSIVSTQQSADDFSSVGSELLIEHPQGDDVLRMIAQGLGALAKSKGPVRWKKTIEQSAMHLENFHAVLKGVHNAGTAPIDGYIADTRNGKDLHIVLAPGEFTGVNDIEFNPGIYVRELFTVGGPQAAGSLTVGSTLGSSYSFVFRMDTMTVPISYAVNSGDATTDVASNLASILNNNPYTSKLVTATASGNVVNIVANNAGSQGNGILFENLQALGGGTLGKVAMGGAVPPKVLLSGTYA